MALKPEPAEPALLRRINERLVLEVIRRGGPSSRASLARASGLTAPTVSKVVESLLNRGLVEEFDQVKSATSRRIPRACDAVAGTGLPGDARHGCSSCG